RAPGPRRGRPRRPHRARGRGGPARHAAPGRGGGARGLARAAGREGRGDRRALRRPRPRRGRAADGPRRAGGRRAPFGAGVHGRLPRLRTRLRLPRRRRPGAPGAAAPRAARACRGRKRRDRRPVCERLPARLAGGMASARAHRPDAVRPRPPAARAARARRLRAVRALAVTAIEVLAAGPLTTFQDLGRPGLAHLGVPPAGAVDAHALELGNRLVGNPPGATALEATLVGPRLRFRVNALVALTGAEVRLGSNVVRHVHPDEVLDIGPCRSGSRVYVCVRGGFAVERVLGSSSTDLLTGLGPPPLRDGNVLALGP